MFKPEEMKKWYDKIAKIYDIYTIYFYKRMRIKLVNHLNIEQGNRILVIACGTGQSFELIENTIGKTGEIIAIDFSEGMLEQAKNRIEKNKWTNIKLIQSDAREISKDFFEKENIRFDFDIILGELAFSVIPDWKRVMKTSISLLNETGKIGLLDWYRPKNDIITKIVDFLAEAETTRQTIEYAKKVTSKFSLVKYYFFKNVYIAIGKK